MSDTDVDAPALPRLLTAAEVAEQTHIPKARIYELSRRDMIPVIRIGRSYRYSATAIAEWIEAGGAVEAGE